MDRLFEVPSTETEPKTSGTSTDEVPNDESERDLRAELTRLQHIEAAATELFMAVWRGIMQGWVPERGPVPDAALELRDALNPRWPCDSDWLPKPLADERAAGYPGL